MRFMLLIKAQHFVLMKVVSVNGKGKSHLILCECHRPRQRFMTSINFIILIVFQFSKLISIANNSGRNNREAFHCQAMQAGRQAGSRQRQAIKHPATKQQH